MQKFKRRQTDISRRITTCATESFGEEDPSCEFKDLSDSKMVMNEMRGISGERKQQSGIPEGEHEMILAFSQDLFHSSIQNKSRSRECMFTLLNKSYSQGCIRLYILIIYVFYIILSHIIYTTYVRA